MHCVRLNEGERFACAGNQYTMLVPRDETHCLEAAVEDLAPGAATPPNAHETFVQLLVFFSGRARVHVGGETKDLEAPGVAWIPMSTQHHVVNIGAGALKYMYVSIWPGKMPPEEDRPWREICARMIQEYADRGFPPERPASR
jgi:mannose-6-phosphate isomerase-like protein (cupin superfamily)